MRCSLKEAAAFRGDVDALFRFAAEQGCAAVQIHLPDRDRLAAIERAMRETGVRVASVNAMSCDMLGPDRAKQAHEHRQVERALAIADRLGAPTVTNFLGGDPGLDLAGNVAEFARVYEPHARIAERLGLRIGFENCPMLAGDPPRPRNLAWSPAHWRACFAAVDSPALGLELDVSHCVYCGLDAPALIREWRERIHHVQIKDAKLTGKRSPWPQHELCPLGEGSVPARAVFEALREIGYRGYVTSDIEGADLGAVARNLFAMQAAASEVDGGFAGSETAICAVVRRDETRRQELGCGHLTWWAGRELTPQQRLTLGRCVIRAGEANERHVHTTCSETLLVLRGRIEHTADASGRTVELGIGDAIVIPPGLAHRARSLGDEDAELLVAFDSADRDYQPAPLRARAQSSS